MLNTAAPMFALALDSVHQRRWPGLGKVVAGLTLVVRPTPPVPLAVARPVAVFSGRTGCAG